MEDIRVVIKDFKVFTPPSFPKTWPCEECSEKNNFIVSDNSIYITWPTEQKINGFPKMPKTICSVCKKSEFFQGRLTRDKGYKFISRKEFNSNKKCYGEIEDILSYCIPENILN